MAEIDRDEENFSMVNLSIGDRLLIRAAIESYCKEKSITLKEIAKDLKISRAQLYVIFESRTIDLITLIKLQKKFNFSVLDSSEVEEYISLLEFDLFPIHQENKITETNDDSSRESFRDEWLTFCRFVEVNSYYAFLYLRHIGNFLWIDDREYLRKNKENLPFWNSKHKFKRNINSVFHVPKYEEARGMFPKRKLKKEKNLKKIKLTEKEMQDFLDNDSGIYEIFSLNDPYVGKKISEFIENALISRVGESNVQNNNEFGVTFNFPKEPIKIFDFNEKINIPIAGTVKKWSYYHQFVNNLIKISSLKEDVQKDHEEYHEEFMNKIYKLLEQDYKTMEKIDKTMGGKQSTYCRFSSVFPKQLTSFSDDKDKIFIGYEFTDSSLEQELHYLLKTERVLEKNKWGFDRDLLGTQLSNKKYFCDLVAFKDSEIPGKETDGVQFTFKFFKNKNTLQVSTLERIKKTTQLDKWDKHIVVSNLPYSSKCINAAKNSNITLILESDIENLMDYLKF